MAAAAVVEKKEEAAVKDVVAPEKPITHPLFTPWVLWWDCSSAGSSDNWERNLKQLTVIYTVEEWWCLYNQLPKTNDLPLNGNLSIFRKGVRPVPHDPINKEGGEYQVKKFEDSQFDNIWVRSVLFCIGEVSQKDNKLVVGTVASVKRGTNLNPNGKTVTMWITISEKKDIAVVKRLGKFYKEQIGLGERSTRLPFKPHDKSEAVEKKKTDDGAAAPAAAADAANPPAADAETQPADPKP